jgi:hypothetical protein
MAVESYEQIMARLQGQQAQAPTAASDFANYVQTLLLNPNPQGNMMTDAEAFRADPFRRQNAINANLDAALKKKQMEEEAARAAAAGGGGGMGMMSSGGGGDSGNNVQLTEEQLAFLENETLDQRGARIQNDWFGLKPIAGMLLDPLGTFLTYPKQEPVPSRVATAQTPAQIAQQQREIEQRVIAEFARKMEAEKNAEALAAARAAQEAMNASAMYQDSSYQSYSDSGGGYTGMSDSNSNAGTSGSPSYGSGGFL